MEVAALLLMAYLIAKVMKLSIKTGVDKAIAKTLSRTTTWAVKTVRKVQKSRA